MTTITAEQARALLDGATKGPWNLCAHLRLPDEGGCTCGYRGVIYGGDTDYAVCQPGHDATEGAELLDPPRYPRSVEIANARLIAAAPDAMETIIAQSAHIAGLEAGRVLNQAAIRAQSAEIARLKAQLEDKEYRE